MTVKDPRAARLQKTTAPRRLSLKYKLAGFIVLAVAPLVVILTWLSASQQLELQRASLAAKALSFGRMLAHEAEPAIAFNDRQTARELFESVALDADFAAAGLFTSKGQMLEGRGQLSAASPGVAARDVERVGNRLRATLPVTSVEGPSGTLVIELSVERVEREGHATRMRSSTTALAGLLLGALAAALIGRSIARRIGEIERVATAVAAGNADQAPIPIRSEDEIGALARAFNSMMATIRAQVETITETARSEAERLERMVAERTAELDERNRAMRALLDNVDQGFLSLDPEGRIRAERSAIVGRWLPDLATGSHVWEALAVVDERAAAWLSAAWSMVTDGFLPLETVLDQFPKAASFGHRTIALAFQPVPGGILCVMTDVTAERAREALERRERERLSLFSLLMKNRAGLVSFLEEADSMLAELAAPETGATPRSRALVHTLKGNFATLGLGSLASECHHVEDLMTRDADVLSAGLRALSTHWEELRVWVTPLLEAGDAEPKVEISATEHRAFVASLAESGACDGLASWAQSWRLEPLKRRLELLGERARTTAHRLGRGPIDVTCIDSGLRANLKELNPVFSALVHVVRNAIDHGAEAPDERVAAGKPMRLQITLSAAVVGRALCLEVSDDGRGIDWEKVAAKARAAGLPADSHDALVAALFHDGVSTRDEVGEVSGRGVGLSALWMAVRSCGGHLAVESRPGVGTKFRCLFDGWEVSVPPADDALGSLRTPLPSGPGTASVSLP